MKIRPVILCGGAGTRLWPKQKKHIAKQFIDFGGWNLFEKSLIRCKGSLFDYPIISTNTKYLKFIKKYLKKHKINKYKIILEPSKNNTGPAILSTALINDIPLHQPMMIFTADHLKQKLSNF
jgi:Mannose-1-phosphate guanylyltransferase